jgi:hypothetical protein
MGDEILRTIGLKRARFWIGNDEIEPFRRKDRLP